MKMKQVEWCYQKEMHWNSGIVGIVKFCNHSGPSIVKNADIVSGSMIIIALG